MVTNETLTTDKPTWENLPIAIQTAWIQATIKFYPEGAFLNQEEATNASRREYNDAEQLMPEIYPEEVEE